MLLVDLFPHQLSIRGDRGNVTALKARAHFAGHKLEIYDLHPGNVLPTGVSGVVIGSGPDYVLADLLGDMRRLACDLKALRDDNVPFLAISNGLRLLSEKFVSHDDVEHTAAGVYPISCHRIRRRVGESIVKCDFGELVGFENHDIEITDNEHPLGYGLDSRGTFSRPHGFFLGNLMACFLHGAFLPLNPIVVDWFLSRMGGCATAHSVDNDCNPKQSCDNRYCCAQPSATDLDFYSHMARRVIKKRVTRAIRYKFIPGK
ncbi:type 1 glutamine amidotransferase [Tropheryma whipplei]|uniref:type 1 glutamine amidotransferase n=1 Tax=Tropheryma whipplei TaxID=2039 RepID=UPI00056DCD35|nr:cobalamin biosynthesis protein CobQ [Tropheryma whipplei]